MLTVLIILYQEIESDILSLEPLQEKFVEVYKQQIEKAKSPEEQTVLKDQIDNVTDRWNKAHEETETRRKKIDKLKKPSKSFAEKEEEFVVLLKKLEKKSKEQDVIPVDIQEAHKVAKVNEVSTQLHIP